MVNRLVSELVVFLLLEEMVMVRLVSSDLFFQAVVVSLQLVFCEVLAPLVVSLQVQLVVESVLAVESVLVVLQGMVPMKLAHGNFSLYHRD